MDAGDTARDIITLDEGVNVCLKVDLTFGIGGRDVIAFERIVSDRSVALFPNEDPIVAVVREIVILDSVVETFDSNPDPGAAVAHDMVTFNSNVAGAEDVYHVLPETLLLLLLESPDREARNAHVSHARAGELAGFDVHVAWEANSFRSIDLRAGRVRSGSWGSFDNGVLSAQLYPVLADHHVLSVNSPDHDGVARMGSVYGLLDGLARPNDRALCSGGADLGDGQGHPACHQHGQSHGGQQHYGASHKESRLPSGGGVSS